MIGKKLKTLPKTATKTQQNIMYQHVLKFWNIIGTLPPIFGTNQQPRGFALEHYPCGRSSSCKPDARRYS